MIWHCGILDDRDPSTPDRMRHWIAQGHWNSPRFPEDVRHELSILLAMPGFSDNFLIHNLPLGGDSFRKYRKFLPGYAEVWREVGENWKSISRGDAIKLCHLRPGSGDVPLVCQLSMLTDLKSFTMAQVARDYGVTATSVQGWRDRGLKSGKRPLPPGFELLLQSAKLHLL